MPSKQIPRVAARAYRAMLLHPPPMHQRGQSTLEYVALLAVLCALLVAGVASARFNRLGPRAIAALKVAIAGDERPDVRARALATARNALSGDTRSGAAAASDALVLLRAAFGARGASPQLAALAGSLLRIRRPDLYTLRSYALVPTLSVSEFAAERRGLLLRRVVARGDERSVETTSADVAPQVRLLSQADEAQGLLRVVADKEAARHQRAWLTTLGPLAIAGVAAVAPEAIAGVAVAGPEVVEGVGEGVLQGSAVADLVAKVRSGQRAVYPPGTRRGDLLVCLKVQRTNRSGDPMPIPGVGYSNQPPSGAPVSMTFPLWHTVVLRVGVVIDEEVTRESPCSPSRGR